MRVRNAFADRRRMAIIRLLRITAGGNAGMKTVEYPGVGRLKCPNCAAEIPAWKSSGMSEMCPHFYCSDCNNAIFRESDRALLWSGESLDVLRKIASSLPSCACGGKFVPGANLKCPACRHEFGHQGSQLERLTDPHIILVDGAVLYGDDGPKHRALIALKTI